MNPYLCITVRFLQPYSHGRGENGEPEWPPSPLRVYQAVVAAAAGRWNERNRLSIAAAALNWLETQSCSVIIAADAVPSSQPFRLYVPDNVTDKVAAAWSRGRDASIADYRTEKDVQPLNLSGEAVHYLYPLRVEQSPHLETIIQAARSITHLGWGIDMVVGDARLLSKKEAAALTGRRWRPTSVGGTKLRVPIDGTLEDLNRKHQAFLNRLGEDGFRPVPPLRAFQLRGYRRDDEPLARPYRVFELRRTDGRWFRYPQSKLIHIAGMVRHLAIEAMKASPPRTVDEDWVERYVAGHQDADEAVGTREDTESAIGGGHRQLSYLPLPSTGHRHADPGVRRIMIVAPVGDDDYLDRVARHIAGRALEPLRGDEFGTEDPPLLIPVRRDNVARFYTRIANAWSSVTAVILPGHDDHKPEKRNRLIQKALVQSGIEHPCDVEWSAYSRFPKSLSAHKYDTDKKPTGYVRPEYLGTQTAVHLTLRFKDGLKVPGPIAIGSGRHCGLGVLAGIDHLAD